IEDDVIFSRTGYTGEDGFEIYAKGEVIYEVIKKILDSYGDVLCGLGARDVLRVEAGLPLYGNELDEDTNPYEANLKWAVDIDINVEKKKSLAYFIVSDSKKIPRKGDKVFLDNKEVGFITSGTFSPFFNKPIGMLYFYGDVFYSQCNVGKIKIDVYKNSLIKPKYYKKV
ncbi:MAG: glycine cleavage T C-terminal barrel domain-containing protein, partial [bacterium]